MSYIHVVFCQGYDGYALVKCQCQEYQMMQKTALPHLNLTMGDGEHAVLDGKTTCMHCRFFLKYLAGIHIKIQKGGLTTKLLQRLKRCLDTLNQEVLLGEIVMHGFTKFSVMGKENGDFLIVSVAFRQGHCFAECLKCLCSASNGNKKKIPK